MILTKDNSAEGFEKVRPLRSSAISSELQVLRRGTNFNRDASRSLITTH